MYLLFFLSFFVSLGVSLIVIYWSYKKKLFIDCNQTNKPQKFHQTPVPRAGGIGIMSSLTLFFLTPFGSKLFIPALLAFFSGVFEDFHNSLSPRVRLLMQIVAALSAVYIANAVITYLGLGIELPYTIGVIFSIFAIVGMSNAINIIDGFNGLAAGIVILILSSLTITAYKHHNQELVEAIIIVLGTTVGFFVLVFPKGKIFLGDGGAYLLGFLVAVFGIYLTGAYKDVSPWYVLSIFIYPVWEVFFSIIRKTLMGKSPMQPDKYHLHMLVFRVITKNNPLTALFIVGWFFPFIVYSTYYSHCSICNFSAMIVFVISYLILYWYLYKKDKATHSF